MKKNIWRIVSLLIVVSMLVAACGRHPSRPQHRDTDRDQPSRSRANRGPGRRSLRAGQ